MKRFLFVFLVIFYTSAAGAVEIKQVSARDNSGWLVEEHSLPIIVIRIAFKNSGTAYDPDGKEGLSKITSSLLDEGAKDLDAREFQEQLESNAIIFSADADLDNFHITLKTLSKNKEKAFQLLKIAIDSPRFDEDALARMKGQFSSLLKRRQEQPEIIAEEKLQKDFFGNHPYGKKPYGTEKSLKNISRKDLEKFKQDNFTRNRLVITAVGDIGEDEYALFLENLLSGLPQDGDIIEIPEFTDYPELSLSSKIKMPLEQSLAVFAQKGLKRDNADYYKFYVLNYIIGGGGFESRLMKEVRESRGLAYSVSTHIEPYSNAAMFIGEVATRKDKIEESLKVVDRELSNIAENGIGEEELKTAKDNLILSLPLKLDSNQALASFLNVAQLYGLNRDYLEKRKEYIDSVTKAGIDELAKKMLNEKRIKVVIGN